MKRSLLAIASAVALLCLGGTPAEASQATADVGWTYNFTPSQSFISANAPGSGTVSFTNEPTKSATNSSDVVVTNLRVSSTATPDSPDTLSGNNGAWKVGLTITDAASGASDTMTFSGILSGTFSASNSNLTNTFTGTTSYSWLAPAAPGTNTRDLYTVTLTGFTPPGPPSASNAGSISAYVQVTPEVGTSGTGPGTPEPSTLVLSCLGLGFAGLASWRKRRRSLAALLA
ncbi:MAG TPA: PEP-CTERM sorting domain-containing protein [Gemmataceae bacterium]|nr:PEP-CTERM sorting domain-containing protein [Gemmataceae bacterium]